MPGTKWLKVKKPKCIKYSLYIIAFLSHFKHIRRNRCLIGLEHLLSQLSLMASLLNFCLFASSLAVTAICSLLLPESLKCLWSSLFYTNAICFYLFSFCLYDFLHVYLPSLIPLSKLKGTLVACKLWDFNMAWRVIGWISSNLLRAIQ